MKLLIVAALLAIVGSLGSALFSMTRRGGASRQMLNALIVRVALSVGLVLFLVLSWQLGWMETAG